MRCLFIPSKIQGNVRRMISGHLKREAGITRIQYGLRSPDKFSFPWNGLGR